MLSFNVITNAQWLAIFFGMNALQQHSVLVKNLTQLYNSMAFWKADDMCGVVHFYGSIFKKCAEFTVFIAWDNAFIVDWKKESFS